MKLSKNVVLSIILYSILFLTYNILLFTIKGFTENGAAFWISWIFMLIAFACIACAAVIIMKNKDKALKDWIFHFPLIKYTIIYAVTEFILSTIFVIFDDASAVLSLCLQLVVLSAYLIMAILCLLTKDTIEKTEADIRDETAFMRLLRVDADMLCEYCSDSEAKKRFKKFAEAVRYSDPVSNDALTELEKEISSLVEKAKAALSADDIPTALTYCGDAEIILIERNKKCKALK